MTRYPDGGIILNRQYFDGIAVPNLIVEIVVRNESLPAAQQKCREYFEASTAIRNVLLLKFYELRDDVTAASVAVLYRRDGNHVVVADVVSFGSSHLYGASLTQLERSTRCIEVTVVGSFGIYLVRRMLALKFALLRRICIFSYQTPFQ